MGFGFVVARFGLFLRELQIGQPSLPAQSSGLSFWFGTALIFLGVIVNVASVWYHMRLVRELNRGGSAFTRPSSLAIIVSLLLAVVGLAMAIYVISVREPKQLGPGQRQEKAMTSNADNGVVSITGVKRFALIDHSGEAEKAGMHMRPTKLLIFGNPKAGTPLMIASPSIAIDLPLKILVCEDSNGKVGISYNNPGYLQVRHNLPPELVQYIAVAEALAAEARE